MKIEDFTKFFVENYPNLQLPLFIYGADLSAINESCNKILSNFTTTDVLSVDLNSITELHNSNLMNFINTTPLYEKNKFILLENAQKWSQYVKSALLKTLEEAPSYNKILITSTSHLDLTIMSRCMKIHITKNSSNLANNVIDLEELRKIINNETSPDILFESYKAYFITQFSKNSIKDFYFLDYVEKLWDKVNETYSWFRKGELSLQSCTQIMSNLILDHLNQISSL